MKMTLGIELGLHRAVKRTASTTRSDHSSFYTAPQT